MRTKVQVEHEPLKEREREILGLIAAGLSNQQIAEKLYLTLGTVKWYNKRTFQKLNVRSRTQAILRAREFGLLEKSISAAKQNLPTQNTVFIGRERELVEIQARLADPAYRLLTLLGPGGIGKTRLALEAASRLVDAYPGGIWFVELARFSNPEFIPIAVASALGLSEHQGIEICDVITNSLRSRPPVLLVLDNCEHLLETCANFVLSLLKNAPKLQILATSRHALGVSAETICLVHGLSLQTRDKHQGSHANESEAVRLFIERAQRTSLGFSINQANEEPVYQICQQLDGLPLAIELAAAQLNMLSPNEIATRLTHSFRILTTRNRDIEDRHQTMRAVIDWSYSLLTNSERLLFNQLSVFRGGFTLEAAQAICKMEPQGSDLLEFDFQRVDVFDLLSSLVDKSMIVAEHGIQNESRYHMLETLREYGQDQLTDRGQFEDCHRRHAVFYMNLAETAEPETRSHDQVTWMNRLEIEHDNFRAALVWAFELAKRRGNPTAFEIGIRIVQGLWWFWYVHIKFKEGYFWSKRCLMLPLDQLPPLAHIRAYAYASLFGILIPNIEEAVLFAEQALSMAIRLENAEGMALSLLMKGKTVEYKDPDLVKQYLEQSLAIYKHLNQPFFISWVLLHLAQTTSIHSTPIGSVRELFLESMRMGKESGDKIITASALFGLGGLSFSQGNFSDARDYAKEGRSLYRAIYPGEQAAYGFFTNMGYIDLALGDLDRASQWFQKTLALGKDIGISYFFANAQNNLGHVTRLQGNYDQAEKYYRNSMQICKETGNEIYLAEALRGLGNIAFDQDNLTQAFSFYKDSFILLNKLRRVRDIIDLIDDIAKCAAASDESKRAVKLFAAENTLRESIKYCIFPVYQAEHERWLTLARSSLSDLASENAWIEGQALAAEGWETVASYALNESNE